MEALFLFCVEAVAVWRVGCDGGDSRLCLENAISDERPLHGHLIVVAIAIVASASVPCIRGSIGSGLSATAYPRHGNRGGYVIHDTTIGEAWRLLYRCGVCYMWGSGTIRRWRSVRLGTEVDDDRGLVEVDIVEF